MATLIHDITELQAISSDLAGTYELANDISASGFDFATLGDATHPFTGQIDGKDYKISTLTISNIGTGSRKAAFIYQNTGTVQNLHLEDCSITAQSTNNSAYAGAFAYTNGGTIEDCWVTGAVTAIGNSAPAGYYSEAGGIAAISYGTISHCYSSCTISVTSNDYASAGGIVDWNDGDGVIEECYATGNLTVVAGAAAEGYGSGLVSDHEGTISNCYSLVIVNVSGGGTNYGAGFVDNNQGSIENSYSTGTITADTKGGLCRTNSGTISNSYWENTTSGQATSDGGTGKTTAEMKDIDTFSTWTISNSGFDKNSGYPFLSFQVGGSGYWLITGDYAVSPRSSKPVDDKITLEAIRNIELESAGQAYIDKSGNFVYQSRYGRIPT